MRHPTPHPQRSSQLPGSRWTRHLPGGVRHYLVTELRRDGTALLRSALRADELVEVAWRELRDRDRWQPGWRSVLDPVPLGPAALDPAAALHPERVASGTLDAGHDMKPAGQPNQALQPADAAGDRVAPDQ